MSRGGSQGRSFDRKAALRSIGLSLIVNALCPFLIYRALEPRFPAHSIIPLVCATVFPIAGLVLSLARKRAVDAIAILVMAGIAIHIAVTLIARSIAIALVARALDGFLVGLALLISAMIRRPIILLVARQLAAAGKQEQRMCIPMLAGERATRVFLRITLVWGICLIAMSGVHVLLAVELAPADFLLASSTLGLGTILALTAWTGRYLARTPS
ncbi:MAG TPA: VC0807 family protein [Rhizomicrobium sp.]